MQKLSVARPAHSILNSSFLLHPWLVQESGRRKKKRSAFSAERFCAAQRMRYSTSIKSGSPAQITRSVYTMPPKTEHFAMTRLELLFVHRRRLIRATHVRLTRARTRPSLSPVCVRPVYVLSTTLNVRLSTHVCAGLRFCRFRFRLRLGLLLRGTHLLAFRRSCRLRFFRLLLRRLLWL